MLSIMRNIINEKCKYMLVYDLGGGTLDVTVLELFEGVKEDYLWDTYMGKLRKIKPVMSSYHSFFLIIER